MILNDELALDSQFTATCEADDSCGKPFGFGGWGEVVVRRKLRGAILNKGKANPTPSLSFIHLPAKSCLLCKLLHLALTSETC
jgi:hypothetical protein